MAGGGGTAPLGPICQKAPPQSEAVGTARTREAPQSGGSVGTRGQMRSPPSDAKRVSALAWARVSRPRESYVNETVALRTKAARERGRGRGDGGNIGEV